MRKISILLVALFTAVVGFTQANVNLMDSNDSIVAHDRYSMVDISINPEISEMGAMVVDHYIDSAISFSQVYYLLDKPKKDASGTWYYDTFHRKYGGVKIYVLEELNVLRFEFSNNLWCTYSGPGLKY